VFQAAQKIIESPLITFSSYFPSDMWCSYRKRSKRQTWLQNAIQNQHRYTLCCNTALG